MKWIKTLADLKQHILSNKERATKRHLNDAAAEKPGDVYKQVCAQIAKKLKRIGFQYLLSQQKLKLENADREYTLYIKFSSNRNNVAGQYVELSSVFYIESKQLRQFSKNNPLLNFWNDTLIAENIGVLLENSKGNRIWNLADRYEYEDAISTIPRVVEDKLLGIFDDLQNSNWVASEIESGNFELGSPMTTVQYLLMLAQRTTAENYLSAYLTRKPDKILEDYKKAHDTFRKEGMPKEFVHGMGYGYEVALLEIWYQLGITVPNNM